MSADEMPIDQFVKELDDLATSATASFESASGTDQLDAARVEFLGAKNGQLKTVSKTMAAVAGPDKKTAGQKLNAVKTAIESAYKTAKSRLSDGDSTVARDPKFDPTLPGVNRRIGRLHPITQTINELKDIMGRLGFTPAEGPEIEDDWHNFEALNIPLAHPARDPLDNFYLSVAASQIDGKPPSATATATNAAGNPLLLRSQTSTVQIRVMEKTKPPIRIISLGRVYRPDTADWSHYPMFHQIEGLMIDQRVSLADLKTVLKLFATSYLGMKSRSAFAPPFSRSLNRPSRPTISGMANGSNSEAPALSTPTCSARLVTTLTKSAGLPSVWASNDYA